MVSDTNDVRRWEKGALVVGFASLAAAVLVAHASPPEAYELSIYAATPTAFWVGAGAALVVGTFVGLGADGAVRRLALVLAGAAALAVASIPVLRSYYFFGAGDSLTHLGWAKDIAAGKLSVLHFLYPGTHTVAVFLADATGMPLTRAMLLMVMAFTAAFLVFVPLATWAISRDRRASALAALSGLLLLPVNNVSVFDMAHPTSQAIMFFPVVLYLAARYLTRADRTELLVGTPTGVVLAVASVAVVLVHPQQAANVLVVFAAVVGVQAAARLAVWYADDAGRWRSVTGHRTFLVQTVILGVAFATWAPRNERATGAASYLFSALAHGLHVGAATTQRAGSLSAIGGSFAMLFAKLFLVSLVFCLLAGALAVAGLLRGFEDAPDVTSFSRYLGVALVPLGGLFAAYFAVSYEKLHFRQLGFIMVVVTVLGAIALARGLDALSTRFSPRSARAVVGVAFVAMLALSIPTVYQSPYMYQSSNHVTEAQLSGYATAIDHRGRARFVGIRGDGQRWTDGVLGYRASRRRELGAGSLYANDAHPAVGDNFTGRYVASHYGGRYLAFTDRARQRDVRVFDGFRFDRRGFRSLDAAPGLNRVESTGGFELYAVNATS